MYIAIIFTKCSQDFIDRNNYMLQKHSIFVTKCKQNLHNMLHEADFNFLFNKTFTARLLPSMTEVSSYE